MSHCHLHWNQGLERAFMVLLLCKFNSFLSNLTTTDAIQFCQFWQKRDTRPSNMNITYNNPWFLNIKCTSLNRITKDKLKRDKRLQLLLYKYRLLIQIRLVFSMRQIFPRYIIIFSFLAIRVQTLLKALYKILVNKE